MSKRCVCSAACAAALLLAPFAKAWDPGGHMLVDQIAWENLTAAARNRVTELATHLDKTYNDNRVYNPVTIGTWMDDLRAEPDYPWSKWHYINVRYTPSGATFIEPAPPHALSAIEDATATSKDANASLAKRAEALAMLVHLVGDIHMPLHCIDWNDKGGNDCVIDGITLADVRGGSAPNLHFFWDQAYRCDDTSDGPKQLYQGFPSAKERPSSPGEGMIAEQARLIASRFPPADLYQLRNGPEGPRKWAQESYALACAQVYPPQPHPTGAEPLHLTPEYIHRAHETACARIALAGYRVAKLLNDLFAQ